MYFFTTVKDGKLPTKGTKHSACIDFYAREDCEVASGKVSFVPLGIKINQEGIKMLMGSGFEDFMDRHYISLKPRSGIRAKGIISHSGVIDLDYPDEIRMILTIVSGEGSYLIRKGDKVAQALLLEHKTSLFGISSDVERTGGFGSTGER